MSVTVMAWVYAHSEARLADRLVLLAIADEAHDDGTNAFPSLRLLAKKARVSLGTAHAAVERLEAAGALHVERPERTGRGHFNTYAVLMGNVREMNAPEGSETFGNVQERSAQGGTNPLTHRPGSRRSRPPVDFAPTEAHATFAAEHGIVLADELAAWLDWCEANGRGYVSVNAGFSTWLRNAWKFQRAVNHPSAARSEPVGRVNPPETVRCKACGRLEIDCTCAGAPTLALVR